jgi:branched-chain amino acid transport system permease protein
MDLAHLADCLAAPSCMVNQVSAGIIIGLLIFLVACGVSLIFGVLGVINFAHGSLYMAGAYFALTAYRLTDSYTLAVLSGALGAGLVGAILEVTLIRQVYKSNHLLQLLVCYAIILIFDDGVKFIWGTDFQAMGMPKTFALPPLRLFGGIVPVFYVFLMAMALAVAGLLAAVLSFTRFGKVVRAAASNRNMVGILGINTSLVYASVFGLGALLAGLAGALAAPVRSIIPGMGFSILIESFIVTVIGGMGSIVGALVASLLVGLTRSFGSIGFPLFAEGAMYLLMAVVLMVKPSGLFGQRRA